MLINTALSRLGGAAAALAFCLTMHAPAMADSTSTPADTWPDEISFFGESVSSLSQWPRTSAWGISYRKVVTSHLALSLAYLNDGHFPGNHRDGVTGEVWLPIDLSRHLTISAGFGPYYYYDTIYAHNSARYADEHGWAWLASLDAIYQPRLSNRWWSHLFFEARLDHTAPANSIETTSIGLGLGYRGYSDAHDTGIQCEDECVPRNEVGAYYWKTVVNSFSSQTARAEEVEYRRKIWQELRVSIGFLNEGDAQLIRRDGITFEGWLEPSFHQGLLSLGAGFGGYAAIDKYRPSPGRPVSGIVSLTASARTFGNFDIRFIWHRIVTNYNRDTDVVLIGFGYRFN